MELYATEPANLRYFVFVAQWSLELQNRHLGSTSGTKNHTLDSGHPIQLYWQQKTMIYVLTWLCAGVANKTFRFFWHKEAVNCKINTWNRLLGPKNHTLDTLYGYISENIVFQFFARVRDFARPPRANPSSDFSGFHTKSSTDPYEPCDQKSALYKFCCWYSIDILYYTYFVWRQGGIPREV